MSRGKVYIVGAGPGDPELITLKGLRILKEADVVLYDNLVPKELLGFAKEDAELIYVGKASGRHTVSQQRINELLVEKAKQGKHVVRLKGGDPLIFGRASEEMRALREASVDFEIVPGVTAASAACARAKVSLTSRDCASVLSFITGHRRGKEPLNLPYRELVGLDGTIVVYMGVSTCEQIAANLVKNGMPEDTPVLVACSIGLENERLIVTTLSELPVVKEREGIEPPALFIIGRVTKGCS